jgi:GntR family transcriptional regulator, transcriptional repressor for pyruvate dehydrogenase complex
MANHISEVYFAPIKGKRTFEEVSAEIKRMIFKGILKPGDRLPSETQLARQFSVGRQTVRESLRILELSGFLTIQKGSIGGSVIEDTILNTISNSLFDALQMGKIKPTDLTIARLEVEKIMLSYAMKNADPLDFERLQENIDGAKRKLQANIQPFKDNIDFHRLLAKASKNYFFVIVADSIFAFIVDFFSRLEPEIEVSENVIPIHQDILNAMIRKDTRKATTLLEDHILEAGKRFEHLSGPLGKR